MPESGHPIKAIIQGDKLKHFKSFLKSMKKNGQHDEVSLVFTDNIVYLNYGSEFSTESPLLQEEYPDYTRVIPKELDFYILLQVSELRAIVDIADDITTIANRRMSTDLLKDVLKVFNTTTLTLAFYKDDTNVVISTNESPGLITLVPSREA
jgi:DNA polymerase III sliding clamp (beta) subunit (PCNA family)